MAAATTKETSFGPGLFSFLTDLRANNDREWFATNKERYEEQLLEPALAFITAFAPRLEQVSIVADGSPRWPGSPAPANASRACARARGKLTAALLMVGRFRAACLCGGGRLRGAATRPGR